MYVGHCNFAFIHVQRAAVQHLRDYRRRRKQQQEKEHEGRLGNLHEGRLGNFRAQAQVQHLLGALNFGALIDLNLLGWVNLAQFLGPCMWCAPMAT